MPAHYSPDCPHAVEMLSKVKLWTYATAVCGAVVFISASMALEPVMSKKQLVPDKKQVRGLGYLSLPSSGLPKHSFIDQPKMKDEQLDGLCTYYPDKRFETGTVNL